jgi:O-antigen ligase
VTSSPQRFTGLDAAESFFASPRLSAALSVAIVGTAFLSLMLQELIGWAGLIGILAVLVVFAGLSLLARRHALEWMGLLPISLLVFVGWAAISVFWSQYQWATFGSVVYLLVFTMLGVYVALVRDTIQIARAFGDVLRFVLGLSLGLEILSGALIDMPLHFLNIAGNFANFGPVQGVFGTRNQLGVVVVIALVTFLTEFRTKSVQRWTAIGSLALAVILLVLSRSPVGIGTLLIVGLAGAALYGLRRAAPERKRFWQIGLLVVSVAAAVVAWLQRTRIIDAFSASSELTLRLNLWRPLRTLIQSYNLEGWGWVGHWRNDVEPFSILPNFSSPTPTSALNGYLDVWFQLGLVGLLAFLGLLSLAFVRSWLLASKQRSFVYAWPALILVALIISSLAESTILVEFGWLTFVVCSVKAARELSWRTAFDEASPRLVSG